ncbi:unnamed protein product, partial [Choristocarpus tenellus]
MSSFPKFATGEQPWPCTSQKCMGVELQVSNRPHHIPDQGTHQEERGTLHF